MQIDPQHAAEEKRTFAQVFLGRSQDPAFFRALRVALSVVLILLAGAAIHRVLVTLGLLPEAVPFSWSGLGEEMLVKPAGAFVVVLFLHVLRRLICARRRPLALLLAAATGPFCFLMGVMRFGPTQVLSSDVLAREAGIAWLVLLLVPALFLGVIVCLTPKWIRAHERARDA